MSSLADRWRPDAYAAAARFVSDLGADAVALLDARPGERVLDLGCGDGVLTARIAAAGAAVEGVDASPAMVAAAQERGVRARPGRGEALAEAGFSPGGFDAVFSNAALHWMTDPDAVFAGVARLLRPDGRFVAECGGHGNVAALRTALIAALRLEAGVEDDLSGVWWFPTAEEAAARLAAAGFAVEQSRLIPRPTPVEAGAEAWFATLAAPALALAPEQLRARVSATAAQLAAPALREGSGRWIADYVRLRFAARLPA